MPYVKQERRPALDKVVVELAATPLKPGDVEWFLKCLSHQNYNNTFGIHRIDLALKKAFEVNVLPDGDINHILFKYAKYYIKPSYNNYKAFMGEIYSAMEVTPSGYTGINYKNEYREAANWIRIKLLTPYEEEKIVENGDV